MMGHTSFTVAVFIATAAAAAAVTNNEAAFTTHESETLNTNSIMDYYSDNNNMEDDNDEENDLVHIPMRSRDSVLRERNLHHLLEEEEMDEDAATTFAKWARNSNHNNNERSLRRQQATTSSSSSSSSNPYFPNNDSRILQEFSGEGTHFLEAYVGSPAQKRLLAVSSGADFTAFPCERLWCVFFLERSSNTIFISSYTYTSTIIISMPKQKKGCTQCGPIISSFRHTSSTSFIPMPCGRCVGGQRDDVCDQDREQCIARGYNLVDKSAWTAYEARDYVYVGGADAAIERMGVLDPAGTDIPERHGFPLVFACQTEATGWYASQVQDGIMGFSQARTSFVNQMVFQDQLKYPRFCMCFEQKMLMGTDLLGNEATRRGGGGMVTLGGYNPHILDAPLVYVQNMEVEPGTRYKVYVRNIYFRREGGQSISPDRDGQAVVRLNFDDAIFNEKNGGTILDSGVPLLIFDEVIEQSFMSEWKKMVGTDFTFGKMLITENDVKALPTLIIQIKAHEGVDKSFNPRTVPNMAGDRDPQHPFDALLAIPATHYMEYNSSTGTWRAKITLDSKLGSFLGINAMQGHAFFYDLAKDRIGFAESYNCQPKMSPAGIVDDDMFEVPTVHMDTELGPDGRPYGSPGPFDGGMPGEGPVVTTPRGGPQIDAQSQEELGSCTTATCISFVTVGYCIVAIALAVAYKKHKPRDRSKQFDREIGGEDDVADDETEVLNPVFEQHVRNTGGESGSANRRCQPIKLASFAYILIMKTSLSSQTCVRSTNVK
ncbi:hypothetical protein ACHAXR_010522 [Thalassiosira sp. AJA248-18]